MFLLDSARLCPYPVTEDKLWLKNLPYRDIVYKAKNKSFYKTLSSMLNGRLLPTPTMLRNRIIACTTIRIAAQNTFDAVIQACDWPTSA